MKSTPSNTLWKITLILVCITLSVSLFSYILIGTTSRFLQDDYCYAAILKGKSFWAEQISSYLHETTYNGNRFSLTLGIALSELAGSKSVTILPGFMLASWLVGLYALIRHLPHLNRLEAVIVAEALALYTLSITPNWVQSFYWRPAMFPYFAPLVTGTFLILLMLKSTVKTIWQPWLFVAIFALAMITGGFSETAVAVEITVMAVILGISLFLRGTRRTYSIPAAVALLGSITAFSLLLLSPVTAAGLKGLHSTASSLQLVIVNSLQGGFTFYATTAYRPTLFFASALIFFCIFGLAISMRQEIQLLTLKQFVLGLFISIGIAYLLTVASLAPSLYVDSSYPGARALIIPSFISILLAATVGLLIGNFTSGWVRHNWVLTFILGIGIAVCFISGIWIVGMSQHYYPPAFPDIRSYLKSHILVGIALIFVSGLVISILLRKSYSQFTLMIILIIYLVQPGLMGARIFSEYPILMNRAILWDWRESQIIQARSKGVTDVEVRALDSLVGIGELSDNSGFWINKCAAWYYNVNSISAVEPVLDLVRLETP